MAVFTFSDFVKFPLNIFKIFGEVPYEKFVEIGGNEKGIRAFVTKIKRICSKSWYFLTFMMTIVPFPAIILFIIKNSDNLSRVSESFPPPGYALMALTKLICVYSNKKRFKNLIETLCEMFPKSRQDQENFNTGKYIKSHKRVEKVMTALIVSAALNFVVEKLLEFSKTGIWYGKLPFECWNPFGELDHGLYNFVFVWQFLVIIFAICGLLGPDLILYSFIMQISMQFDILCQKLEKLSWKDDLEKFKELIKLHEQLLNLSKDLEAIFSPSILFNFIASSFLICFCLYQITIGTFEELHIKFSFLLVAAMLQVLMLCYCGNKLTTAAENVATAAYNCDWFDRENWKIKAILVNMIQRSQKPTVLTAYKFSILDLEAFTKVRIKNLMRTLI